MASLMGRLHTQRLEEVIVHRSATPGSPGSARHQALTRWQASSNVHFALAFLCKRAHVSDKSRLFLFLEERFTDLQVASSVSRTEAGVIEGKCIKHVLFTLIC